MKNLTLLTETRHSIPYSTCREDSASAGAGATDGANGNGDGNVVKVKRKEFIQCLVANPNVDHDDPAGFDDSCSFGNDNHHHQEAFHYILSRSGILSAISVKDSILWSIDLQTLLAGDGGVEGVEDVEDVDDESWFHLSHEENSDCLVALSHGGAIVSITTDGENAELIGCFDNGIQCAAWSADAELLALVTFQEYGVSEQQGVGGGEMHGVLVPVLMTMNTQFEILSEAPLPEHIRKDDPKTKPGGGETGSPISICWNKKTDNQLVAVSTHDAEDNMRKIRIFKGESLDHVAISRTEDGSGKLIPNILCDTDIAWAGSNTSNLLVCVQRKGRKGRNIVFLEQNGLQHGGFKLENRLDHEEVIAMNFNSESDLFAITLLGTKKVTTTSSSTPGGGCESSYGKVQFYHRNNYHWYLKYEIHYNDGTTVSQVNFDDVKGYEVSIALNHTNGIGSDNANVIQEWRHYRFVWDMSTASEQGTAVVVDGNHLNLTMFQKAMVPPPMYASRISFEKRIIGVCHIPNNKALEDQDYSRADLMVHLNDGTLVFCDTNKITFDGQRSKEVSTIGVVDLAFTLREDGQPTNSLDSSCLRQCQVIDVKHDGGGVLYKVVAVACSRASLTFDGPKLTDELVSFTVRATSIDGITSATIVNRDSNFLEGKVLRLTNWSFFQTNDETSDDSISNGGALIELVDGSLFQYQSSLDATSYIDDGQIVPCESEPNLLEPCPWIAGLRTGSRQLIVGLSSRFRLYFGERQLCDASSSFILSPSHEFLAYVTLGSRSQLRFLPLQVLLDFDPLMGSEENVDVLSEGYEPRNVERGSTLVSILPEEPKVVLQLPRGNLEGVYPRALVLPHIMSLIDTEKFDVALDMMRRQKVDMNLIVDMNPPKFLECGGLRTMVRQVKNMDHLNLFIACLSNYDITEWKYQVPSWLRKEGKNEEDPTKSRTSKSTFDFSTKVNQVCSKMREEMTKVEEEDPSISGEFLLPILSTFAKETPPQLEKALELIRKNAFESTPETQLSRKRSILLGDHAQGSIKYLAFLAEYELLFDTALGMYDFELAKAVARNSQMDPKVYLPMLKHLRNLPEYKAKHEVDVKLKRWECALTNLYKSGLPEFSLTSKFDFSEEHFIKCMDFIEEHNLHKLGLDLFVNYPQWHNQIIISLGERFLKENKAQLSLSIFLTAHPKYLDGAKRAAKACGDYRTFFACVDEENLTDDIVKEVANDIAKEVAAGKGGLLGRREGFAAGARILLDYCQDVYGAIEMLMSAEMWFESRRLALLHSADDMQTFIIDAAVTYAKTCLSDFESRGEKFEEANERYAKVLVIRREAKLAGIDVTDEMNNDETGSQFSLASNASNSSVRTNASASSVGSLASVSSVISAGTVSSFSVINNQESTRHKSKFNKIGRKKKKKKPTRRERIGTKPGSEEELKNLVWSLKGSIIDTEYSTIISETIQFLAQVNKVGVAIELYEAYGALEKLVMKSLDDRIEHDNITRANDEMKARKEGQIYEKIVLECEDEVDQLRCVKLPQLLDDMFAFTLER